MISIEQCRKLIADKSLTDEEIEQVRDELYALANLAFDSWRESIKPKEKPSNATGSLSKPPLSA
jgi:hypothetical protein